MPYRNLHYEDNSRSTIDRLSRLWKNIESPPFPGDCNNNNNLSTNILVSDDENSTTHSISSDNESSVTDFNSSEADTRNVESHKSEMFVDSPEDNNYCYKGETYMDTFEEEISSNLSSDEDSEFDTRGPASGLDGMSSDSEYYIDSDTPNLSEDQDHHSEPLFSGSPLTVAECIILVLQFFTRHCLSYSALTDLLELICLICPKPNKCVKTLYFFRKWLRNWEVPIQKHFYCSKCHQTLDSETAKCSNCSDSTTSYFIEIPVASQMEEFFKRPGFYTSLNYRFSRTKDNDENLEDIYDGDVYKKYCSDSDNFDLRSQTNISFMWNSDGVPLFKSSKISIWPFFLKINELPPSERNKPSNMIMAGLWFGCEKPDANLFMKPFVKVAETLYHGILCYVHDLCNYVQIKAMIICGTCDLPATAIFLNMKLYNAIFGCKKCLIRTENVKRKRVYVQTDNLELRTSEQTKRYASQIHYQGESVCGVKGPTWLSVFVEDFIRYTALDPMHLLAGISKLLLNIWISPEHKKHDASLLKHKKLINERLSNFKPPSFVERTPRKISDFAYWKATEHILWLLIYSPVVLSDILSEGYFFHHMKLVLGIYLLYQDSVAPSDIEKASELLRSYVSDFELLYDRYFMNCIIHSLLHLCDLVRDYGPLKVFTCFPFENANGKLKSLLHATRDAQLQVCAGVSTYLVLDGLKKTYLQNECTADFCNRLETKGRRRHKILLTIPNGISLIERPKKVKTITPIIKQALENAGIEEDSVYEFKRLLRDGKVYASENYTRTKKTASICVEYIYNNTRHIGLIKTFVRVSNCSCIDSLCNTCRHSCETLAIISHYETSNPFYIPDLTMIVNHIYGLQRNNNESIHTVNVLKLQKLYFLLKLPNSRMAYAIKPLTL